MEEKKFNWKAFLVGGLVIAIIVGIATLIETQIRKPTAITDSIQGATIPMTQAITVEIVSENLAKYYQDPTAAPTEAITIAPTEPPTEKKTEEKIKTEPTTEPPAESVIVPPAYIYTQPPQIIYVEPQPQEPVIIEPDLIPSYSEIQISPTTLYLKPGQSATIQIIYPAGLSTQGADWSLDNQEVAFFSDVGVDVVTVKASSAGTTTVLGSPKGTGVTLHCTVIVQN